MSVASRSPHTTHTAPPLLVPPSPAAPFLHSRTPPCRPARQDHDTSWQHKPLRVSRSDGPGVLHRGAASLAPPSEHTSEEGEEQHHTPEHQVQPPSGLAHTTSLLVRTYSNPAADSLGTSGKMGGRHRALSRVSPSVRREGRALAGVWSRHRLAWRGLRPVPDCCRCSPSSFRNPPAPPPPPAPAPCPPQAPSRDASQHGGGGAYSLPWQPPAAAPTTWQGACACKPGAWMAATSLCCSAKWRAAALLWCLPTPSPAPSSPPLAHPQKLP